MLAGLVQRDMHCYIVRAAVKNVIANGVGMVC